LVKLGVGKDGVAVIRFEGSDGLNFLGPADIACLLEFVDKVAENPSARALILAGGENFSAGTDFPEMMRHLLDPGSKPQVFRFLADQKTVCDKIRGLRIPTVSVVRGLCAGSALGLAAAADFLITDTTTRIRLPEAKVGTWGGFVFVNMDPDCAPLAEHLGELPRHFERWPLADRYKEAHVAKVLGCNWKVAQEAFMEAYHVVATHPQLLPGIGDANSQYDVWGNFSRAITANMTPSPHLGWAPSEQDMLDSMLTRSLDAEPALRVPEGMTARQTLAMVARMQLQGAVGGANDLTDAELADSFYYTLFPNFHPWGAYNRIVYRFRPYRNDPDRSIMEVIYLAPFRGRRPKPAPVHWLGEDEDWTHAPELGFLARVFNQDTFNLAKVQRGLHAARHSHVTFARYQETKIRHFHTLLGRWIQK
jgi:phenylpropionate dioxygenase-like ring-hydroxylating dioxygenase large terminal subunit